ncbi:protein translation factor sui1, putative [Ichthyophthirius multifiliis]|uniref:Protein translation factor sui1, putative n=1 Tax=Ichthyophthirius multifiliis TaxID=5932 RepID=G0QNZ8_ICHMU|nr:protein translation factor sui1, putative [Ichthyophthirius multifiliis]EGR33056.1 protein translation factor sui1, putative [Ichthyophthirius multifiliis]|eukprot:XP_004037042.1 protein translation factor sui1, putative [Ichthyophthirius multifiliis]
MDDKDDQFGDDFNELDDFSIIHIRVQQRRGRKCFTSIEGIPPIFDYNKIIKYWKKWLNCNGTLVEEDGQKTIRLNGDHRENISKFLANEGITTEENIRIHGV